MIEAHCFNPQSPLARARRSGSWWRNGLGQRRELAARLAGGGRLQIHRVRVDVPELIKSAVGTLEAVARRKKIALELRVEAGGPVALDEKLVRRAIENLLENAVKYTPAGKDIAVTVRQATGVVIIEIADRGPGIPAGMRAGMFDDEVGTLEASKGGIRNGIGLGLYMVKLVAEGHGGKVEVLDRDGGGALFRLQLEA